MIENDVIMLAYGVLVSAFLTLLRFFSSFTAAVTGCAQLQGSSRKNERTTQTEATAAALELRASLHVKHLRMASHWRQRSPCGFPKIQH